MNKYLFGPVLALLLRHIPHHSSLWSSQERRWPMPIQVSHQIWINITTFNTFSLFLLWVCCFFLVKVWKVLEAVLRESQIQDHSGNLLIVLKFVFSSSLLCFIKWNVWTILRPKKWRKSKLMRVDIFFFADL